MNVNFVPRRSNRTSENAEDWSKTFFDLCDIRKISANKLPLWATKGRVEDHGYPGTPGYPIPGYGPRNSLAAEPLTLVTPTRVPGTRVGIPTRVPWLTPQTKGAKGFKTS
eukprot:2280991-Rhodomonas_salina.1